MKKLIITGGTGYIGRALLSRLESNYKIVVLTRSPDKYKSSDQVVFSYWDGISSIREHVEGAYGIINLVGENIGAKAWTKRQKERILTSRSVAAQIIKADIEAADKKPMVWIQGSATGIYGEWNHKDMLNEYSPHAENSFLATVCEAWERPIQELKCHDVRKIIIRTGVVLSEKSELMKKFLLSFKFGVASITGTGDDNLPWIHLRDEVTAIEFLLEQEGCAGIYNLTAPNGATVAGLVTQLKSHRRSLITIKVPRFALSLLFGKEKTNEIVLTNQRVYPERLLEAGFKFTYPTLQLAVDEMMRK